MRGRTAPVFVTVVVLGALVLQACGNASTLPFAADPKPTITEVRVVRGPLVASIETTGIVTAPIQSPLSMRVSGVVKEIKSKVGEGVHAGDTLLVLDAPDLEAQVQVAEAGVESAQAKLDQVQVGSKPEDLAVAQAQIDMAMAKLAAMQSQGRAEDVATATAQLDAAHARLAALQEGGKPETVAQAQQQVQIAQSKVDTILAGGRPDIVAQAQQQVRIAQSKVDTIVNGPNPAVVAQAQAKVDQAKAQLALMLQGPKPEQVQIARLAIDKAKNDIYAAQAARDAAAGRQGAVQWQIDQANAQVAAAQTELGQAQQQLALLLTPPTTAEIDAQKAVIAQAEAALQAAQAPYTAQDLEQAKASLAQAQSALAAVQSPYTAQDLQQARATLAQAQSALALARQPNSPQDIQAAQDTVAQAQQNLAKVKTPYQAEDLKQAQADVDEAKQAYESKKHPYNPEDIAVFRAAVSQAKAQLAVAKANLSETVLAAPFDGVVQQVNVVEGQLITPGASANASTLTNAPLVVLGKGDLIVQATVDETDIAKVRAGQPVKMAFEALGQKSFVGKVDSLPVAGTLVQGVVSYNIVASIDPGQDSSVIKPGMTSAVSVQVAKHDSALLLPYDAIQIFSGKASVNVPNAKDASQPLHKDVTLGLTDGKMVEIVNGLNEGDRVLEFGRPVRDTFAGL